MSRLDGHLSEVTAAERALLVLGGDPPTPGLLAEAVARSSYIAAADRGLDCLAAAEIVPDEIFGDMDSVSEAGRAFLAEVEDRVHYLPTEKDDTDGQVAVAGLFARGYREVLLLGALGGRRDHEWGTVLLACYFGRQGKRLVIEDERNCITYLPTGVHQVEASADYFSLIPLAGGDTILTLEGFYYPLDRTTIPFGVSRTLSNRFVAETGVVTVHQGEVLAMRCKDGEVRNENLFSRR